MSSIFRYSESECESFSLILTSTLQDETLSSPPQSPTKAPSEEKFLSLEKIFKLVYISEEVVERCVILSTEQDLASNLAGLFKILLKNIGSKSLDRPLQR